MQAYEYQKIKKEKRNKKSQFAGFVTHKNFIDDFIAASFA